MTAKEDGRPTGAKRGNNDVIDKQVAIRRSRLNAHPPSDPGQALLPEGSNEKWGLALSGGGIRSATFCFGLLRALANKKTLLRFDLLSTVSGGGYIGTMLGCLFHRARNGRDGAGARSVEAAIDGRQERQDRHSPPVGEKQTSWFLWWLRANGRYLIPRGAKDTIFAFALFLRNLAGIHLELGLIAVTFGLGLCVVDLIVWAGLEQLGYAHASRRTFDLLSWIPSWLPTVSVLLPLLALDAARVGAAYWAVPWVHPHLPQQAPADGVSSPANRAATGHAGTQHPRASGLGSFWMTSGVVAALDVALAYLFWRFGVSAADEGDVLRTVLWVSIIVLITLWIAGAITAKRVLVGLRSEGAPAYQADVARNILTQRFAWRLRLMLVVVLAGLIDRVAWNLAFADGSVLNFGLTLGVAAAVLRALAPLATSASKKEKRSPIATAVLVALARVAGYGLSFLLVAWWVSIVYQAVLGALFTIDGLNFRDAWTVLGLIAAPSLGYMLWTGRNLTFLNLSSLHSFYRARLVRSYMGAANGRRFGQDDPLGALGAVETVMPSGSNGPSIDEVYADDDMSLTEYRPQDAGGPVHLINVCINQTQDPRGNMFNQDRRGLPLTLASGGLMRVSQEEWQPVAANSAMSLGRWMAISGAAFSTGMGVATRGGISALMAFAGIRLGYWWSEAERTGAACYKHPSILSKSRGLVDELLGNFKGTAGDDWYLSDGGHFENTAAYALLAQRARVIVLADCGADPDYSFGDLENLVRIARIDLQAEIRFQRPRRAANAAVAPATGVHAKYRFAKRPEPPDELSFFGSIGDLASEKSTACLALAKVVYGGEEPGEGILILIKPNICAGLPVDLINFKEQYADFPQQTTGDQFFSEAQWESYFLLGQFLGGHLDREFIQGLLDNCDSYFENDERSPFDKPKAATADEQATTRLPARILAKSAAVGTTVGLGAAATIGVSMWQAIDSAKTAFAKRTSEERAALKEIADLWAKVPAAGYASAKDDKASIALSQLASAIVRTADTLCPTNEATWYQRSVLAKQIGEDTIKKCSLQPADLRGTACQALLEFSEPELKGRLPNCLTRSVERRSSSPPPYYWAYDYSATLIIDHWHPCDPRRGALVRAEARFRQDRGALEFPQTANQYARTGRKAAGCVVPLAEQFPEDKDPPVAAAPMTSPPVPVQAAPPSGAQASLPSASPSPPMPPVTQASASIERPVVPAVPAPASTSAGTSVDTPINSSQGNRQSATAQAGNVTARGANVVPFPSNCSDLRAPRGYEGSRTACEDVKVYIQIYGDAQQSRLSCYQDAWQGWLVARKLPIENVTESARRRGRPDPSPVTRTTVRFHDADSMACANALGQVMGQTWRVEPLSPRLKAQRKTVELWVAPEEVLQSPATLN